MDANRFIDVSGPSIDGDLDSVPALTAWFPEGLERVAVKNPRADLAYMRALFPFVPIWPMPDLVVTNVLVNANQSYDLNLPAEAVVIAFAADTNVLADWWISTKAAAAVPSVLNNDPNSDANRSTSINGVWIANRLIYVGQLKTVSAVSTTANRTVQVMCWLAPRRPT